MIEKLKYLYTYIFLSFSRLIIFITFFAILETGTPVYSADSIGRSGAAFLEIGVGSRPIAMGEAFTAETGDINSIYYNPAGLGTLRYPEISILHQQLILDSRFENISYSMPLYNGFLGLSNSIFWVPPFDKIDINGNKTGDVIFFNGAFTAAYGYNLGLVNVGGSIKYIYQKIDTLFVSSGAIDVGVLKGLYMYSPFDAPIRNFFIGLSIQNMGTKAKDDPLPRLFRFGISYKLTKWVGFNMDITENFIYASDIYDFTSGFDESFRVNTGIEFKYLDILALRMGYKFNDGNTFSIGLGFNYAIENVSFQIDTAFRDSGIFGPSFSINLSFKLIPMIVTVEQKKLASDYYMKGIKYFINNDIEGALREFKSCKKFNPYYPNIDRKIKEIEEIIELKKANQDLDEELKKIQ